MTLTNAQLTSIAALRVSLGLLLFWWGLGRVTDPEMGLMMQEKFYFGLFPSLTLQQGFGVVEIIIGVLVILGLFRSVAMPAQLLITGFSAMTILPALLDPFGLWLPFEKLAGVQHLFYPSVIALTAGIMMYLMSGYDRLNLDNYLQRGRQQINTA